jgi:hypothetical protein
MSGRSSNETLWGVQTHIIVLLIVVMDARWRSWSRRDTDDNFVSLLSHFEQRF